MSQTLESALRSIQRELERCAAKYPFLGHERFLARFETEWMITATASDSIPSKELWDRFFKANRSQHSWELWHSFPDRTECGRFWGSPDGSEEYKCLGESLDLIVREIEPHRKWHATGWLGWLQLIHEMAIKYPTPLLRVERAYWKDYEKIKESSTDKEFPPTDLLRLSLTHNVFTSSIAAIDCICEPDKAVLVGNWIDDFPVTLWRHEIATSILIEEQSNDDTIESIEGGSNEFIFRQDHDGFWELKFCGAIGPEGKRLTHIPGLEYYAKLLRVPFQSIESLELSPTEEKADESHDLKMDREYRAEVKKQIQELEDNIEIAVQTENPDRVAELTLERNQLSNQLSKDTNIHGRSRPQQESKAKRAYDRVKTYLGRARAKMRNQGMPQLAEYLQNHISSNGTISWSYRPTMQISWVLD